MNSEEKPERDETSEGVSEASGAEQDEEEIPYPPFFDYLQSEQGHEIATRILAILEGKLFGECQSARTPPTLSQDSV